jgi:hypothetical protein
VNQLYVIHLLINLESDIAGGNSFKSPLGTVWSTIMVRTGVYVDGVPTHQPTTIAKDVFEAVQWALAQEKWHKGINT